jgi:2-(1,2-epoxy-1,2-dihydrophenyl)acetyl-CoA isomerase
VTVQQTEVAPGVLRLTLDEPAKRNALSVAAMAELAAGLERLAGDDDLRVGLITGAGEVFCAGGDTSRMGQRRPTPWERRNYLDGGVGRLARLFVHLDKPVIAAVNGPAVGAGMDLALWCDFRFAAPGAYLRAGFVDLGLTPGFGSAWHLARQLGRSQALEILLTGRRVTAQRALELGIYRSVSDEFAAEATALATELAGKPLPAVRATKRLVQRALATDVLDNLELAWSQFGLLQETPEHTAAVEAMRNRKR